MQFQCPHCKAILASDAVTDGMMVTCPECGATIECHPYVQRVVQADEKTQADQWFAQNWRNWLESSWNALRQFSKFEQQTETDFSRFKDASSVFELARLFPLAVICLGFGWILNSVTDFDIDFYSSTPRWLILPLAALALYGAIRSIKHFLRPKSPQRVLWCGICLFSAVAGILLLMIFQYVAIWVAESDIQPGRNILLGVVKIIGICYEAVYSDNTSLWDKFLGYIGGVGLCEEATKLFPLCLVVAYRHKFPFKVDLTFPSFLMLGFFSGLGFGIGEALTCYTIANISDMCFHAPSYINEYEIHLNRWFACVPSHAIYTVIDAAFLWMFHRLIASAKEFRAKVGWFALCVASVAILHGVYDVLNGLPFMGITLDAASLVLMWWIVRLAARSNTSIEDEDYPDLRNFAIMTYKSFGKSFAKMYLAIFAGIVFYPQIVRLFTHHIL